MSSRLSFLAKGVSAVLLALFLAGAASADKLIGVVEPPGGRGVTTLRSRPRRTSEAIAPVPRDTRVIIDTDRSQGSWYAVRVLDLPNGKGEGFVRRKHVTLVDLERPFEDLHREHWAYPAIAELAEQGLLQGMEQKFIGEKHFSRFEMAVVLARMVRKMTYARESLEKRMKRLCKLIARRNRASKGSRRAGSAGSIDSAVLDKLAKHSKAIARLQRKLGEARRIQSSLMKVVEGRTAPIGRIVASSAINRTLVKTLEGDVAALNSQSQNSLRRMQVLTLRVQSMSRRIMDDSDRR